MRDTPSCRILRHAAFYLMACHSRLEVGEACDVLFGKELELIQGAQES